MLWCGTIDVCCIRRRPWDMSQPRVMWHSRIAGDPASESALP